MENQLKRLLTEQDLHNLREVSVNLSKYSTLILQPLKNTLSGEARRAIQASKRIDEAITKAGDIITQIEAILGEKGGSNAKKSEERV